MKVFLESEVGNRWKEINRQNPWRLRFNHIILISDSVHDFQGLINDLDRKSFRMGLKINGNKIKTMCNKNAQKQIIISKLKMLFLKKCTEIMKTRWKDIIIGRHLENKQIIVRKVLSKHAKRKVFNHVLTPSYRIRILNLTNQLWKKSSQFLLKINMQK